MAKITRRRLLNPDTDPLPIGPTVFSHRRSKKSTTAPTSETDGARVQESPGKDKSSNPALANQQQTPEKEEARHQNRPEKGRHAVTQKKRRGE